MSANPARTTDHPTSQPSSRLLSVAIADRIQVANRRALGLLVIVMLGLYVLDFQSLNASEPNLLSSLVAFLKGSADGVKIVPYVACTNILYFYRPPDPPAGMIWALYGVIWLAYVVALLAAIACGVGNIPASRPIVRSLAQLLPSIFALWLVSDAAQCAYFFGADAPATSYSSGHWVVLLLPPILMAHAGAAALAVMLQLASLSSRPR